jgi:hypothetical protein
MLDVKSVAASAFKLEVLLSVQTHQANVLNRLVRLFGETEIAFELSNDITLSPGVMSGAAETLRLIESFLQDGPPQHSPMEYLHSSYELLYGNEVIEPELTSGGSFIVCPFGAICVGIDTPDSVIERWELLDAEMIAIEMSDGPQELAG